MVDKEQTGGGYLSFLDCVFIISYFFFSLMFFRLFERRFYLYLFVFMR